MTMLNTGEPVNPEHTYVVAGWASIGEDVEGPAIWDVVENYLKEKPLVSLEQNRSVTVVNR